MTSQFFVRSLQQSAEYWLLGLVMWRAGRAGRGGQVSQLGTPSLVDLHSQVTAVVQVKAFSLLFDSVSSVLHSIIMHIQFMMYS